MIGYKVIDNFLSKQEYENIIETFTGNYDKTLTNFPWYMNYGRVGGNSENGDTTDFSTIFHHMFKQHYNEFIQQEYKYLIDPILKKMNIEKMMRIKANLYPRNETIIEHGMHTDYSYSHKGLLYFVNTNNGYTLMHDGTKIESVANRALFFDPSLPHTSSGCTDERYRSTIVFNFK